MVKILLGLWGIVYLFGILKKLHALLQIGKAKFMLKRYIYNSDNNRIRRALLRYYPIIERYDTSSGRLAYDQTIYSLKENCRVILNNLLMKRNYAWHEFIGSFNPLESLMEIVLFPSTLLRWFGYRSHKKLSLFISVVG